MDDEVSSSDRSFSFCVNVRRVFSKSPCPFRPAEDGGKCGVSQGDGPFGS